MRVQVNQPGAEPPDLAISMPVKPDLQLGKFHSAPEASISEEKLAEGKARRAAQLAKVAASLDPIEPEPEVGDYENGGYTDDELAGIPGAEGSGQQREDLDSIEIQLPNGKVALYGPTRGAAKALVVARIVGLQAQAILSTRIIETLVNVHAIDGVPVTQIRNMIEAQQLLNKIGDDGLEVLFMAHNSFWPPATIDSIKIIKKNHRQPGVG